MELSDRGQERAPVAVLVAAADEDADPPAALGEACRAVLAHRIARTRGRVREQAQGTVVADFRSPLAALRCALRIRHDMAALCERLPEAHGWRIGVALAGATEAAEAEAARLAGLAEPGRICVSRSVQDAVAGQLDVVFEAVGEAAHGALAVLPSKTGGVFRFKRWSSPPRRRAGLLAAVALTVLAVLALALLGPPNG